MQPSKSLLAAFCFVVTSAIIGCGPIDYRQSDGPSYYPVQFGVMEGIDYVQREGGTSGAGALIRAIAGGVIGHQIGSGAWQRSQPSPEPSAAVWSATKSNAADAAKMRIFESASAWKTAHIEPSSRATIPTFASETRSCSTMAASTDASAR